MRDPMDPFVLDQRGEAFVDGYGQAVQDAEGFAVIYGHDTSDGVIFGKLRANSEGYEEDFARAAKFRAAKAAQFVQATSSPVNPLVALIEAEHAAVDGMVDNMVVFVLERAVRAIKEFAAGSDCVCLDTVDWVVDVINPHRSRE